MATNNIQGLKALIADYCKFGYKLFLLAAGTKIPLAGSNGVSDATDDVEQIENNLNQYPDANLAIAAIDILIADVDNKKGKTGSADLAEMEEELGKLPDCPTVRTTTGGLHYYFAMPAEKIVGTNGIEWNGRKTGIDIQVGRQYVVAPPSIIDGKSYEWLTPIVPRTELPELPLKWREYLSNQPKPKITSHIPVTGTAKGSLPLPPASEAIIELCRQEVAKLRPAIQGKGGDKQTFRVACVIFHDFGLSEPEGKPIMDAFNGCCVPPWNEKDLQHKIDTAIARSGKKPRGWRRFAKPVEGEYHPPIGAFVLNPSRTLPSAKAFLWTMYRHDNGLTLRYFAGDFYHWTGNCYRVMPPHAIKGKALDWLTRAVMFGQDKFTPFPANDRTVNDIIQALKTECLLSDDVEIGSWIGDDSPPTLSPIFANNCVFDWRADVQHPHDPRWFNLSCIDANIVDDPPEPERWKQFQHELWGEDQASKDLLHEFMGLTLTLDTSFQKILLIVGDVRTGKGTILRILILIHRPENVAAPSADSLTKDFGLQPLIGKPVAIIADARFAGKDIQTAIERLLNISGEDSININRKHREFVTTKLPTRVIIGTNAPPILPDSSGAMANRFLALKTSNSFLGREDRNLMDALAAERDGIVKLMIEGLRRLHRQGFSEPAYQRAFIRKLEGLGSPIRDFVKERCELGTDKEVSTDDLYRAYEQWLEDDQVEHKQRGDRARFGKNLKAAFPDIERKEKRGLQRYWYSGIALRRYDGTVEGGEE